MKEKRSASRSDAQQAAEVAALNTLSITLGVPLEPKRIVLQGQQFHVDGYYEDQNTILVAEVWAHIGRAKVAQRHKVMSDLLKLALITRLFSREQSNLEVKSYLIFIDDDAAYTIQNKSWGALAAKEFGINVAIVKIDQSHYDAVRVAQVNQNLHIQIISDTENSSLEDK